MRFVALVTLAFTTGCAVTPRVAMRPTDSEDAELSRDVDAALRKTLEGCGVKVVESPEKANVVFMPRVEAVDDTTVIHVTSVRPGTQQLLGNFSLTAKGASPERRVKALMGRVCNEALALMPVGETATHVALTRR